MTFHDARSRAREAALFALKLAALFAALVAGTARAGGTPIGDIPLSTNIYNAAEVDALIAGAASEPDPTLVTNLVAESEARILNSAPDAAAWTALKLIVADLWRRVDTLDADGSDALSAAAAEQLINDRVAQMYASLDLEFADWRAQQTSTCRSTTISANTSGVAAQLSPVAATRYYASTANNRTLGFSSFAGVGNLPCILILERFSSVSWPSGAKVETAYAYNSGNPNVYAIYKLNGTLYAKKIYP